MSSALAPVAVRGGTGGTGLSGTRASSTMWTRNMIPASGPWTPVGPRGTLMILRLSITLGRSASSLAAPSSARTRRALSSPVRPLGFITSPLGSRLRPRASSVATRSPREFVTSDERISPSRPPTLTGWRGAIGREGTMEPLAPGPMGILAGSTDWGSGGPQRGPPRECGVCLQGHHCWGGVQPQCGLPGERAGRLRLRGWTGVEEPRTGPVEAGGVTLAGPMGKSGSSRRTWPADQGPVDPSTVCRGRASALRGPPP